MSCDRAVQNRDPSLSIKSPTFELPWRLQQFPSAGVHCCIIGEPEGGQALGHWLRHVPSYRVRHVRTPKGFRRQHPPAAN